MAKIGTAQIEIKPVLNEESLEQLGKMIEDRVRTAMCDALNRPLRIDGSRIDLNYTITE